LFFIQAKFICPFYLTDIFSCLAVVWRRSNIPSIDGTKTSSFMFNY
jgi:hypothetical protein